MSSETWKKVDEYFNSHLHTSDEIMDGILKNNEKAGLPAIDVAPNQGKMLHLLAKIKGAKIILEIGTLGAYSTVWLARALPADGRVVTLEADKLHAEVAEKNLQEAGLDKKVDLMIGPALESLPHLKGSGNKTFDFIFIDADKKNNAEYLEWALALSEPGSVIIIDNVVRDGKVIDESSKDSSVRGSRELIEQLANEPRIDATAVQTVGSKGYDGFVLAYVK